MNKKVLALGLSAAMVAALGLTACGGSQASESSSSDSSSANSAAVSTQSQSSSPTSAEKPSTTSTNASNTSQQNSSASSTTDTSATASVIWKGASDDGRYEATFLDEFTTTKEIATLTITDTTTGDKIEHKGTTAYTSDGAKEICTLTDENGDSITFTISAEDETTEYFIFDEYGKIKMTISDTTTPSNVTNTNQSDTSQTAQSTNNK